MHKVKRLTLSTVCCVALSGCIPEDVFLSLDYSPDGQLVALVSEHKGLVVVDPAAQESRLIAAMQVEPASVTWTSDSLRLVYAASDDGSLDLYVSSLDQMTTRITRTPAREHYPLVVGEEIVYLSTETGLSEFTTTSLTGAELPAESARVKLPDADRDLYYPRLSPTSRYVAAFGFENLRPQIYTIDLHTGTLDRVTSETDPLSLLTGPLAWHPQETGVGFLRKRVVSQGNQASYLATYPWERTGAQFVYKPLDDGAKETLLLEQPAGIRHPVFLPDESVLYVQDKSLTVASQKGQGRSLIMDLGAAWPEPGGDEGEIVFITANQLLGVTTSSLERTRILTLDLEEKFLLAEEYFRTGSSAKSYDVYEELASSVQRTRDPQMARFVYIANLRRLGRTTEAVKQMEELLAGDEDLGSVHRADLWRILGFSYLLELDNPAKAEQCFEHTCNLTSDALDLEFPDSTYNALAILRETSPEVVRLYASAVKARLNGNYPDTDRLFGDLLTSAPAVLAVQREYLNALDGFDHEVYQFSPTQRPFDPTVAQRAEYLERLVRLAPDSPYAEDAKLELFLARIEMGSFSRARELLMQALLALEEDSRPDGLLDIFHSYLEIPELQPWINQAIPEVFLHPDNRPHLEKPIVEPGDRLLLGVVATKMMLLQNKPDQARREADAALAMWNLLPPEEQVDRNAELYGRLLVLRGAEAEQRGLFSEAANEYDQAVKLLTERAVDNFEFQEEVRYRAGLLRTLVTDAPHLLQRMREIELRVGNELVNPNWEYEGLAGALREYVNVYDTTTGTVRLWAAYETGMLAAKMQLQAQARAALYSARSSAAPLFLRRKVLLELAVSDEYTNDPWNAARGYARMADLPGISNEVRLWCSYQIARLHIGTGYKVSAAREALAQIMSLRPETPLAIQAQELLLSTESR